jgi:hypothetical protein
VGCRGRVLRQWSITSREVIVRTPFGPVIGATRHPGPVLADDLREVGQAVVDADDVAHEHEQPGRDGHSGDHDCASERP